MFRSEKAVKEIWNFDTTQNFKAGFWSGLKMKIYIRAVYIEVSMLYTFYWYAENRI